MGILMLSDGQISGRDTVICYSGSYVESGDQFTATIKTQRHTEGLPSVFGIDEVELMLTGRSTTTTATCSGQTEQAPGVIFEATLIRMVD